jgi:hypothetical protein
MIGSRVGYYDITVKLGEGGMGWSIVRGTSIRPGAPTEGFASEFMENPERVN